MNNTQEEATILDEEINLGDADLFDSLLAELGDGSKPRPKTAAARKQPNIGALPPAPPAPQWKPVARTLRVTKQICACGCEHTSNHGLFLEEVSTNLANARRFRPLNLASATAEQLALPVRTEFDYAQLEFCHLCYGIENALVSARGEGRQAHLDFAYAMGTGG